MDIGVIGVGTMGKNHVRVYSELKDVDNVYIYDVDGDSAKRMGVQYEVSVADSIDSLLKSVDAVSICAPTRHHFEIAKKAIECGVNCLIEKPISLTSVEGERLLEIINDRSTINGDLVVGVGHIERFNPIVEEIKKLLESPRYMEIRRHNPGSSRVTDACVASDLMIHDIDLVWNYFLNGIGYELYSLWDNDLCKAIGRFNRCIVSLSASRIGCKKIRSIYIEDEEFSIDGDFMNQDIYIYRKPQKYGEENARYTQENIIEKVLVNKVEPLKEELKTFVECVKDGRPFPITPEQAVLNLKIVEEIKGMSG
jgi:predicted dehydrogenase